MAGFRKNINVTDIAGGITYDDLFVNISTAKLPNSNTPTWDTFAFGIGGGTTFGVLGFGIDEYAEYYVQSTHAMQLNSHLDNHIHWTIPTNDTGKKIKFQLNVIAAPIGGAFTAVVGSPFTVEYTLLGTESGKHNYMELAEVPSINTTVSSIYIYIMRLTRIAASSNDYGSDVYILYNDCHIGRDTLGSFQETSKF